jgi:hypothetical protein
MQLKIWPVFVLLMVTAVATPTGRLSAIDGIHLQDGLAKREHLLISQAGCSGSSITGNDSGIKIICARLIRVDCVAPEVASGISPGTRYVRLSIDACGFYLRNSAFWHIIGGSGEHGGGVLLEAGAKLVRIIICSFLDCQAPGAGTEGGGIKIASVNVTIVDVCFESCRGAYGSFAYVHLSSAAASDNTAPFLFDQCSFASLSGSYGPGVTYARSSSTAGGGPQFEFVRVNATNVHPNAPSAGYGMVLSPRGWPPLSVSWVLSVVEDCGGTSVLDLLHKWSGFQSVVSSSSFVNCVTGQYVVGTIDADLSVLTDSVFCGNVGRYCSMMSPVQRCSFDRGQAEVASWVPTGALDSCVFGTCAPTSSVPHPMCIVTPIFAATGRFVRRCGLLAFLLRLSRVWPF